MTTVRPSIGDAAFRRQPLAAPMAHFAGEPALLQALGVPLVGGVEHLPVLFTPTAPVGAR
jgi:hypothetical protein